VPSLSPISYAHGALSASQGSFLVTDFLNLGCSLLSSSSAPGSGLSLAAKLAKLHGTPAPIPEGFNSPQFGFPVTTCCGSTEQPNSYSNSWADFFANQRLRSMLRSCEKRHGQDVELKELVEKTASVVVPRLLGDDHLNHGKGIMPVVVHGDLWSGNHGRGSIGNGPMEEVIFDPSSCYAHSEYELGIMQMFGGFGDAFFAEYHKLKPKDEPVDEYVDRIQLYEL
jgi:protein-ribulosamine 3-kinase